MNTPVKASAAAGRTRTRRRMRPLASTTLKKCRSSSGSDKVPEKLEALKKLISPAAVAGKDEEMGAEQVFKETASYILRLRTQVVLLQRLLHLYASSSSNELADADTAAVL